MVENNYVQCKYCKATIRLRFQMGYFNIPFDICCPKCGVHIGGCRKIIDENSLSITNAETLTELPSKVDYYADLSVELPSLKINKFLSDEALYQKGFGPFMTFTSYFDYETYQSIIKRIGKFLLFREAYQQEIHPLVELLFSGNIVLARDKFFEFSECFIVENELDATMALHQMTVMGTSNILPNNTIDEFLQYQKELNPKRHFNNIISFIQQIGGTNYLNTLSKRFTQIFSKWLSDYEKFNPIVMLVLGNALEKLDKETYGITTTSFEDMKSFYSNSYELLLDMVELAVGLNNLKIRNDFNKFHPSVKVSDFTSYRKQAKPEKLKALVKTEPFSKPISINRHIRNAVAHYNYEFEPNSQRILFFDHYKGKENAETIYLADLALLCYENVKILLYLNELLYNLKKIDFIRRGFAPHIKPLSI